MLENRLVDYLSQFAQSAIDPGAKFSYRNNCQEPMAIQLTTEIKDMAKGNVPLAHWQSEIDKGAKLATRRIVNKIDSRVQQ